jgi:hypothetical protein
MTKLSPTFFGAEVLIPVIRAPLYYLWVFGLGTSFVKNWTSMVYQLSGCDLPGAGYKSCDLSSPYLFAGQTSHVNINCADSGGCAALGGNVITVPNGCYAEISYQCTFEPFLNLPANRGSVTTWLQDLSGPKYTEDTSVIPGPDGKAGTAGIRSRRAGGGVVGAQYQIMFRVNDGLMGCTGGIVRISAYGSPVPLIPAGCRPKPFGDVPYPHTPVPPPAFQPSIDERNQLNTQRRNAGRTSRQGAAALPRNRHPRR